MGNRHVNYGHLQTKNSDVSLSHLWQNAHSLNYVIPEKINFLFKTIFDLFQSEKKKRFVEQICPHMLM